MKKSPFFKLCVGINIAFVFLYIHIASQCQRALYQKQAVEAKKKELAHTKQTLTHQIYLAQSRSSIQEYAQKEGMIPVTIKNIQRIRS